MFTFIYLYLMLLPFKLCWRKYVNIKKKKKSNIVKKKKKKKKNIKMIFEIYCTALLMFILKKL